MKLMKEISLKRTYRELNLSQKYGNPAVNYLWKDRAITEKFFKSGFAICVTKCSALKKLFLK